MEWQGECTSWFNSGSGGTTISDKGTGGTCVQNNLKWAQTCQWCKNASIGIPIGGAEFNPNLVPGLYGPDPRTLDVHLVQIRVVILLLIMEIVLV